MKVFFRRIHLYLGLASGLFLVLVCLTGSLLVFEQELEHLWHPARYYVAAAGGPRLPLAQLTAAVRAAKPKAKVSSFKIYADPTRTVEVNLAGSGNKGGGKGEGRGAGEGREGGRGAAAGESRRAAAGEGPRGGQGPGEGRAEGGNPAEARGPMGGGPGGPGGRGGKGRDNGPRLFLNPYTGAIVGEVKPQDSFFHFVEQLHRGLVAGRVGKLVMGINALIFLFILGTGIVLWWPAARKALTARLTVKWGSSWKRLNHDFHIVLGFYTSVFLFVMAITGVGMSFDWVGKTINTLTHSPQQRPEPPTSTVPAEKGREFGTDTGDAEEGLGLPVWAGHMADVDGTLPPAMKLSGSSHRIQLDAESADEIVAPPARQRGEQSTVRAADSCYPSGQPITAERNGHHPLSGGLRSELSGVADIAGELADHVCSAGPQRPDDLGQHPGAPTAPGLRMDDEQHTGHDSSLPGFRMPAGSSLALTARSRSTPSSPTSSGSHAAWSKPTA